MQVAQFRKDKAQWREQEEEREEHSSEQGEELSHTIPVPSTKRDSGARQQMFPPRATQTQRNDPSGRPSEGKVTSLPLRLSGVGGWGWAVMHISLHISHIKCTLACDANSPLGCKTSTTVNFMNLVNWSYSDSILASV